METIWQSCNDVEDSGPGDRTNGLRTDVAAQG